jgi:hypothetical protein
MPCLDLVNAFLQPRSAEGKLAGVVACGLDIPINARSQTAAPSQYIPMTKAWLERPSPTPTEGQAKPIAIADDDPKAREDEQVLAKDINRHACACEPFLAKQEPLQE